MIAAGAAVEHVLADLDPVVRRTKARASFQIHDCRPNSAHPVVRQGLWIVTNDSNRPIVLKKSNGNF